MVLMQFFQKKKKMHLKYVAGQTFQMFPGKASWLQLEDPNNRSTLQLPWALFLWSLDRVATHKQNCPHFACNSDSWTSKTQETWAFLILKEITNSYVIFEFIKPRKSQYTSKL